MKKLYITLLLAAAMAPGMLAQSKLDANAMRLISDYETAARASRSDEIAVPAKYDLSQKVLAFVTLHDGYNADDLHARGIKVENQRGNIALAWVDAVDILGIRDELSVKRISLGDDVKPLLDKAREITHVDEIQQGTDPVLGRAYTGKGVVVGLLDTGLDPNHVNFKDAEGNNRVKIAWETQGKGFASATYSTPEEVARMTTDDANETHGTHVLGIMAGSFNGKGTTAIYNKFGRPQKSSTALNPYYGVAYDADIAAMAGTLSVPNITLAAEKILEFANQQGKPAIINFSLGTNIGPHDGTSDLNLYLAEIGKEAIICMSSGNEGGSHVSLVKTGTAGDNAMRFFVSRTATSTDAIDIWSSDGTPVKISFVAYNKNTGEIDYSFDVTEPMAQKVITGSYYTAAGYIHDEKFDKAFGTKGAVFLSSEIDPNSGRYHFKSNPQTAGGNSGYYPGYIVEVPTGKTVYAYSQSQGIVSNGVAGYSDGNDEMSVSDMSCGDNILCVGSFNSRVKWPAISASGAATEYWYNGEPQVNEVSDFSSYGTLPNGQALPHILGPGQGLISSYSKYYIESHSNEVISASAEADGRKSYWAVAQGTSMSSPFVAGTIALWAEANPDITIDDVKRVLKATAVNDEYTAALPARSGYGKLDALAGLKEVLGLNSVGNIAIDDVDDKVLITAQGDGSFNIAVPGASAVSAQLFNLSGQMVDSYSASGDDHTFAPEAAHGVYLLKVTTPEGRLRTAKVTLN